MTALHSLSDGLAFADLLHLGRTEMIAVYLIETRGGLALVDPGPTSCLEVLHAAIAEFGAVPDDVRHVLLTHIHLDHAGVAGTLARANPRLRVHVHARGAPHLIDPSRLLDSARRIYGAEMDRLWGEFLPVPADRLVVLDGGEQLQLGERRVRVAYTPGHAWHHVCYLDERTGLAFTGDVAGEGSSYGTPPLPVSPPPDIDLEVWRPSLDHIEAWGAEALLLTHFGAVGEPSRHIRDMWACLLRWSELVRESLDRAPQTPDDELAREFADLEHGRLTSGLTELQTAHVDGEAILSSWYGLARYWRKKAQPAV